MILNEKVPVFFIRHNLADKSLVSEFDKNNIIAIHLASQKEKSEWDALSRNKKPKSRTPMVNQFFKIRKHLRISDVLVIAFYKSDIFKIGVLEKGSSFKEYERGKYYKYFALSNVKPFTASDYPIFRSIIPQQGTISEIHQRKTFIKYLYEGRLNELPISLENISDKLVELMCLEWLRSNCCKTQWRLNNQLLLVGGNYAQIDLYGMTDTGKTLAAQVSNTKIEKTIATKISSLNGFKRADIKLMFCDSETRINGGVSVINLVDVWQDLYQQRIYKDMLTRFVLE